MCNCRKASSCPLAPWSSWTPAVGNGQCKDQTRHQDKKPSYTYVMKEQKKGEMACFGIDPDCRPPRITDTRKFCRCKKLECLKGQWTAWEIHSWTGSCPTERRLQPFREVVKYQDAYKSCNGIGPLKCPDVPGQYRAKEVTCPKLPLPANAIHLDAACDGANSKCTSSCRLECKAGYSLSGNKYVTCHGSGQWNRAQGSCVDSQQPNIKCPNIPQFGNKENENYQDIDLVEATATDNSGLPVKITTSHVFPLRVYVGSPVEVTYTATDAAGNKKSCRKTYIVIDQESPKVTSCPEPYRLIRTGSFPHRVFWGDAQFHDNVDSANQLVHIPSHANGSPFHKGRHTIVITARDRAFNKANCTFVVELEMVKCPVAPPPKHGSAQCNVKKNGVKESFICTVSCKQGSWFLQGPNIPKLYNFYMCSMDGEWGGTNAYNMDNLTPSTVTKIPKGEPLWPDCSVGATPDGAVLEMQVFGGKCTDQAAMDKLKQDFVATLQKDFILNYLFCITHTQNCAIENIIIYCSKRKRRNADGSQSDQMVIKFAFAVREKNMDTNKLNQLSANLEKEKSIILQNVKVAAPKVLNDYSASVSVSQKAEISCEPGYEYTIPEGTSQKKCLKCPLGTYFDSASRTCEVCEHGFYQDEEGAKACKKCPQGTSTSGSLGTDFHDCKAICRPGTYSENGLTTCLACPIATYQPLSGSSSCIACPGGKVTDTVGAAQLDDCMLQGIKYEIHSEGCGDPGRTNHCGKSTIKVDGVDHCKHARGINFVAIKGKTGKMHSSAAFDWHGSGAACASALNWLRNLPDHTIVMGAYQDEATSRYIPQHCDQALELIGGKKPFQREYRASFAIVGYKGVFRPFWTTQKMSSYGRGPTDLNGSIKLMPSFKYEISSEGWEDASRLSRYPKTTIKVDGTDHSKHKRGINFVAVDGKTGTFQSSSHYDWYAVEVSCKKSLDWIKSLPDRTVVLAAYQDEGSNMFKKHPECRKALEMIGGKAPFQTNFRASFVLVGYKGKDLPYFVKQDMRSSSTGPTKLSGEIVLNISN
ncbi:sushi, von Willebrand factor type A, EGF and pentraxin domain-containing protein 1-like [Clytia hemisphaerica]|uniref:Uncharacterized protein n=1 Tax=Clytia hemisphaerica TaxID=252671 RepID=A0A7M5X9H5_9CNID